MDAEPGQSLIVWTVRACVALYAIAVWQYLFHRTTDPPAIRSAYRAAWTAAWLLCVVHVVFAFHFEHRWSHNVAMAHTAKVTERAIGLDWGGGLYINYLFLIWWGIDVIRLYRDSTPRYSGSMHIVAAFMMINATVVFGPRWWFIPACAFSLLLLWNFRRRADTAE